MSGVTPDQQRLTDEAIDLVIRQQNDPANPAVAEMIRAWRARGPDNERAWARIARLHGASGKVLATERRAGPGLSRRSLVIGGVIGAGAVATGYALLPHALIMARADVATGKREQRDVALPDGSRATLGPESALALDFGPDRRSVELLAGMAFFEVMADPQRLFTLSAGNMQLATPGTAFDVSNDAGILNFSVERGTVETRFSHAVPGITLKAGEWMTFDPASRDIDRGTREPGQIGAWRDNLIVAERDTVSALTARIGRWLPGLIVMADPSVGRQRVSGIFDLNDPLRALEAVVGPTGARVRQVSSLLTVISPV